jgi:hypothetical protein
VRPKGFDVFEAETLLKRGSIAAEFPSDLAFLEGSRIAIGTWEFGTITDLPGDVRPI